MTDPLFLPSQNEKEELELSIQNMQGRKAELLEKESALKLRKDEVEHDIKRIEDSNKKIASEITDLKLYLNTLEKENEVTNKQNNQPTS